MRAKAAFELLFDDFLPFVGVSVSTAVAVLVSAGILISFSVDFLSHYWLPFNIPFYWSKKKCVLYVCRYSLSLKAVMKSKNKKKKNADLIKSDIKC